MAKKLPGGSATNVSFIGMGVGVALAILIFNAFQQKLENPSAHNYGAKRGGEGDSGHLKCTHSCAFSGHFFFFFLLRLLPGQQKLQQGGLPETALPHLI